MRPSCIRYEAICWTPTAIKLPSRAIHQALVVAQWQCAKLCELRAATCLARLWRDQGQTRRSPNWNWKRRNIELKHLGECFGAVTALALSLGSLIPEPAQAQEKRPNIVMLMTDDTGWNDFGPYGGGAGLGHPTLNVDQIAKEGAVFTSWYGQASCTAGRAAVFRPRHL